MMASANATTGITGHRIVHGFDLANPPKYERPGPNAELLPDNANTAWREQKLGDLLRTEFDLLARQAINDGVDLRSMVLCASAKRSKQRYIKTKSKVYILRGLTYTSRKLQAQEQQ